MTTSLGERVLRLDEYRVDRILALVLIVELELEIWLRPHHDVGVQIVQAVGAVFYAAPVAVRRRRPAAALIACGCVLLVQAAAGGNLFDSVVGTVLPPVLLAFGVGAWLDFRASRKALGLAFALFAASAAVSDAVVTPHRNGSLATDIPAVAALIFGPAIAGGLARERSRRAADFRRLAAISASLQDEQAFAAVAEERARISRELQQVIASGVTSMVDLANEARLLVRSSPQEARTAISAVEETGREALADVRRLLGVLRKDGDSIPLAPQPDVNQIPALLAALKAQGFDCELASLGEPVDLLPGVSLVAYRVIESSLQILAAPGRRASVAIRFHRDWLELEVATDNRIGNLDEQMEAITQRVRLYDGSLRLATNGNGGSAIQARLPLAAGVRT